MSCGMQLFHLVLERNKCVEKIKACKQKLSELEKYENIIKKNM
jgi:hypothetical protein